MTYLPNIYKHKNSNVPQVKIPAKTDIHLGCFGAVRPMKNHLQQALGALDFAGRTGRNLYFHINGTRIEGNGSQDLKHLRGMIGRLNRCELVEHPWMTRDEFYQLLQRRIDGVLQCSLTESFNIVSADAAINSVPVIAGPEIRWLSKYSHCDSYSSQSISQQLEYVFGGNSHHLEDYVFQQQIDLQDYNKKASDVWKIRFG